MHLFHVVNIDSPINTDLLIDEFNRLQSSFRLEKLDNDFSCENKTIDRKHLFNHFEKKLGGEIKYIIAITKKPLDNSFFSDVNEKYQVAIISTNQSQIYSPPFKIEDYLQSEILLSILLILSKMNIGHYDTRGCLFDFCGDKKDIVIKLHSGSICSECKARLIYYGVADEEISSTQKVLWHIAKDFISSRVSRGCPIGHGVCKEFHEIQRGYSDRNIFLAISFGKEFQDMIDHLRTKFKEVGFNLNVVNQKIENKNILCKICKTIQMCKYGIAEFSGFRHNVSYEFGLMQAFGVKTIGIIKNERLTDFEKNMSDMKGIEIIPYQSVSGDLFEKLKEFVK